MDLWLEEHIEKHLKHKCKGFGVLKTGMILDLVTVEIDLFDADFDQKNIETLKEYTNLNI